MIRRKLTLNSIKKDFKNRGYTLLSKIYKTSKIKLKYKCPLGHIGYISYNMFYHQNNGCGKCWNIKRSGLGNPNFKHGKSHTNDYWKEKHKQYHKLRPWARIISKIRSRCNNPKTINYKYYGGKGIKCLISKEELKELWFRDKAYLMKKPSIDRIDSDRNYTFNNCRFIEHVDNVKRMLKEYIRVKIRKYYGT